MYVVTGGAGFIGSNLVCALIARGHPLTVLSAVIAVGEVALFGFLGSIVDWLSSAERAGFLEREGTRLWLMGGFEI